MKESSRSYLHIDELHRKRKSLDFNRWSVGWCRGMHIQDVCKETHTCKILRCKSRTQIECSRILRAPDWLLIVSSTTSRCSRHRFLGTSIPYLFITTQWRLLTLDLQTAATHQTTSNHNTNSFLIPFRTGLCCGQTLSVEMVEYSYIY